jgi:hypothetical protein
MFRLKFLSFQQHKRNQNKPNKRCMNCLIELETEYQKNEAILVFSNIVKEQPLSKCFDELVKNDNAEDSIGEFRILFFIIMQSLLNLKTKIVYWFKLLKCMML